jgi:hypothetical protein
MTPQLIKHEQFFPVVLDSDFEPALVKAETFLEESAKEHQDFEFVIQFQDTGIIVSGYPKQ